MTHAELFIKTIDDLRERQIKGDEYNMLRACGLLRHLLTDALPLVQIIERSMRKKLLFTVSSFDDIKISGQRTKAYTCIIDIDYTYVDHKTLDLDAFRKHICFIVREHDYSVSNIIKAGANIKGGVHTGRPENEKERIIVSIDDIPRRQNKELFLHTINAICNVVYNSSMEFYCKIAGTSLPVDLPHNIRLPY